MGQPVLLLTVIGAKSGRPRGVVNDLYAGYDVYQGRANHRRIPVMVFSRVG